MPDAGPSQGRGPRRKSGDKLTVAALPAPCLHQTSVEQGVEPRVYPAELLHKQFAQPLNVVVIVKPNLKTQARAHVLVFSSDVGVAWDKLVEDSGVRFHIAVTVRDANQPWGVDDVVKVTATGVRHAANLALCMVSLSAVRVRAERTRDPAWRVLDRKAVYRGST